MVITPTITCPRIRLFKHALRRPATAAPAITALDGLIIYQLSFYGCRFLDGDELTSKNDVLKLRLKRVSRGPGYPNTPHLSLIPSESAFYIWPAWATSRSLISKTVVFLLFRIARIERILTTIGHVLGKIFLSAQTRTLRKREGE